MADIVIPDMPVRVDGYDWWELRAFWCRARTDSFHHVLEHHTPRFQFAGRWPVPGHVVQALLRRHWGEFEDTERWDPEVLAAFVADHRRAATRWLMDHRTWVTDPGLWGVEHLGGAVYRCPTLEWAQWVVDGTLWTRLVQPAAVPAGVPHG